MERAMESVPLLPHTEVLGNCRSIPHFGKKIVRSECLCTKRSHCNLSVDHRELVWEFLGSSPQVWPSLWSVGMEWAMESVPLLPHTEVLGTCRTIPQFGKKIVRSECLCTKGSHCNLSVDHRELVWESLWSSPQVWSSLCSVGMEMAMESVPLLPHTQVLGNCRTIPQFGKKIVHSECLCTK